MIEASATGHVADARRFLRGPRARTHTKIMRAIDQLETCLRRFMEHPAASRHVYGSNPELILTFLLTNFADHSGRSGKPAASALRQYVCSLTVGFTLYSTVEANI